MSTAGGAKLYQYFEVVDHPSTVLLIIDPKITQCPPRNTSLPTQASRNIPTHCKITRNLHRWLSKTIVHMVQGESKLVSPLHTDSFSNPPPKHASFCIRPVRSLGFLERWSCKHAKQMVVCSSRLETWQESEPHSGNLLPTCPIYAQASASYTPIAH